MRAISKLFTCIIFSLILLFPLQHKAQNLNLGFLFRPGVTVGGEHTQQSALTDSSTFGLNKYRFQATIPLKTKLNVDFKNLDIKASQTFLTFNASLRTPNFSDNSIENQNIQTYSAGITSLRAGLFSGLWVYSANVYVSENKESMKSNPQINGMGYLARIKLNNLKFIYFYGLGAVSNYGKINAIPLAGFTTKISKKVRLTTILPLQINLSRKISNSSKITLGSNISGFNSVYRNGTDELLNYRHLKNHLTLQTKIAKHGTLSLEGGYSAFRKISLLKNGNESFTYKPKATPYLNVTFNYSIGKSLFGIKLDGVD